ncbi:MAG: hypothetical protein D6B25_14705 [Desulfobulbaceae bacterium]|mgnify:CR=1 FL=1|nr:MAG: hypothetical protein D6B25_14705 [Desulfobulbaceae bacterium]
MDEETYRYYEGLVRSLDYAKLRAVRLFSSFEDTNVELLTVQLEKLSMMRVNLDQVRILETLSAHHSLPARMGWELFDQLKQLRNSSIQALTAASQIKSLQPTQYKTIIKTFSTLKDSGNWAAKAFFEVKELTGQTAISGLEIIARLTPVQHRAVEQVCKLTELTGDSALALINGIQSLSEADAVTLRTLFSDNNLSATDGRFWLTHYFDHSGNNRDEAYRQLGNEKSALLLTSFFNGADHLIWKINNLHAVTDDYGREIRTRRLINGTNTALQDLFNMLHPGAVARYDKNFQEYLQTGQKAHAVTLLKQATSLARRLVAKDLSSANLYGLLARGSELYDSSFRDILVPVLFSYIKKNHSGSLLDFLKETDPTNLYVADFVISCAQKGKLTSFFPDNPQTQKAILDLTATSAFKDERSLILFSATFYTLLEKLQPPARSYLISQLIGQADNGQGVFALQIRVILQYYLQHFHIYLSASDTNQIRQFLASYGMIDLSAYTKTDFSRWKADKKLVSLSIFQDDDDGEASFRSYIRHLVSNGYRPRISQTFKLVDEQSSFQRSAQKLISAENRNPGSSTAALFRLSVQAPVITAWVKRVNGYELVHNIGVYQNELTQRSILRTFLNARIEMFAQRGHSYWRQEQLLEPMRSLAKAGEISTEDLTSITRFLSIGSCGGIRVYSALNSLFKNQVDILATVGTGKASVNNPYNQKLFEIIALAPDEIGWQEVARQSSDIFEKGRGADYLQPGSLPSILHKMMDFRTDI